MSAELVLASASVHRAELLANAGLVFGISPAEIDERAAEAPLVESGATPGDVALVLARAKAEAVSAQMPGSLVIGGDQVLSLDDEILHKATTMEEARRRLLKLSGRTHQLSSAVVLAEDGETVWEHVGVAHMTMRELSPEFIGRHLSSVGARVLGSVGVYQIERQGIQLFEAIDGDFFTIVGVPLLPLLGALRDRGVIEG